MKKFIYFGGGMLLFFWGLFFWSTRTEVTLDTRIPVTATFYPAAFLAEQIGGNLVSVKTIVPPGVEPHDFDPSLRDVADMYGSQLIVINGGGVDRWAERLEGDFQKQGAKVLVLSRSVDMMIATEDHEDDDGAQEENHDDGLVSFDPHFWLDPISYKKNAEIVLLALIDIDPAHASTYRSNFSRFEREIATLDAHFRELISDQCRLHTVIVSHNAFSYLAKRYAFEVRSIASINPEQEASAGDLAEMIRFMRERNIHFILNEPFGNTDITDVIGREASAETLTLNPIEGLFPEELASGKNYFTVMDENWITLRKALECE